MKKGVKVVYLALLAFLLAGCVQSREPDAQPPVMEPGVEENVPPPSWSTRWVVYWDLEIQEELAGSRKDGENLCLFSCFFDDQGGIYVPEGFEQLQKEVARFPGTHYLSVTNDLIQLSSGKTTQKDVGVLERIFEDEASMESCVRMLLETAQDYPGLEVDFENLQEPELWQKYCQFLGILGRKAEESGKQVRIVLPCSAPVDAMELPDMFRYSVMCYNLFGYHSGPGPKADTAFLRKTAEKFKDVPNISFALATGGFAWNSKGKVSRALTQSQAQALLEECGAQALRDAESGALHFSYMEDGETFSVWYADSLTLGYWQEAIRTVMGENALFDLWRVGGNQFNDMEDAL